MNIPTLETERLILRKFMENDLEALYKIYSDKEANKFLPWFSLKTMEAACIVSAQLYKSLKKSHSCNSQYSKKDNIVDCKCFQIGACMGAFAACIAPEGNNACQRGNQCAEASDVDTIQQRTDGIGKA